MYISYGITSLQTQMCASCESNKATTLASKVCNPEWINHELCWLAWTYNFTSLQFLSKWACDIWTWKWYWLHYSCFQPTHPPTSLLPWTRKCKSSFLSFIWLSPPKKPPFIFFSLCHAFSVENRQRLVLHLNRSLLQQKTEVAPDNKVTIIDYFRQHIWKVHMFQTSAHSHRFSGRLEHEHSYSPDEYIDFWTNTTFRSLSNRTLLATDRGGMHEFIACHVENAFQHSNQCTNSSTSRRCSAHESKDTTDISASSLRWPFHLSFNVVRSTWFSSTAVCKQHSTRSMAYWAIARML